MRSPAAARTVIAREARAGADLRAPARSALAAMLLDAREADIFVEIGSTVDRGARECAPGYEPSPGGQKSNPLRKREKTAKDERRTDALWRKATICDGTA